VRQPPVRRVGGRRDRHSFFRQVLELREPGLLWRVLQPIAKPMVRRRMAQIAQELKSYAEGRPG
jgi:hypothetical protein